VQPSSRSPRILAGTQASKSAFEQSAAGARFLHVATHGYFAEDPAGSSDARVDLERDVSVGRTRSALAPMSLCGVVLSGANHLSEAHGALDGLLTAEELANIDLSGCELAVLSACDTNVGVRRAGQGVASLQRALHIAGARSVITSLWKVPDEATKELMLDFYRRLWVEQKPKHQALWEAKTKLREAEDERGASKYTTRDWAAWVLTGEPN
jgi:CHAT domain-containing protein